MSIYVWLPGAQESKPINAMSCNRLSAVVLKTLLMNTGRMAIIKLLDCTIVHTTCIMSAHSFLCTCIHIGGSGWHHKCKVLTYVLMLSPPISCSRGWQCVCVYLDPELIYSVKLCVLLCILVLLQCYMCMCMCVQGVGGTAGWCGGE